MEYAAKERFKKTLDFLHMTKQTTYQHIFTDITYIIALYYGLSTNSDLTPILRKLIKEEYNKLDVNKLTSFFIPFYNIENWTTLKNANKNETKNLKEFLHEHEETFSLFIKLWNLNIRCYEKDLTKLCTSFYYHENLPSKRKYQKMLDAYEK